MPASININAAHSVQLNMASAAAAATNAPMAGQGALRQQAMHAQAMKDASPSRCISSGAITHVPSPHKGLGVKVGVVGERAEEERKMGKRSEREREREREREKTAHNDHRHTTQREAEQQGGVGAMNIDE